MLTSRLRVTSRLILLAAASCLLLVHGASAQAVWSGEASISASLTLGGGGNVLSSSSLTLNDDSVQTMRFDSGNAGQYWYEFNLTDGDYEFYSSSTGNLRLYLNSQDNSWTTIPSGRIVFSFTFPETTTGIVTGFSSLSDNRNILPSFTVTNNGAGTITFTQTADINFSSSGPAANLIGTFTTTAVPEPSTYAIFAGLAALGVALVRRRR